MQTITAGCKTDHGGVVIENDSSFIVDGKGVHLEGMSHWCPKCKIVTKAIASGMGFLKIGGKTIIVAGDKTTCGATFLAGQQAHTVQSGIPKTSPPPLIATDNTLSFSNNTRDKKKPWNPNPYRSDPDSSRGALSGMTYGASEMIPMLQPDDPDGGAYKSGVMIGTVIGPKGRNPLSGGTGSLGMAGRTGKQKRLKDLADDPKVSSADRGWIKQELNEIAKKIKKHIRNPPGKEMAHERGREAAKGYDYKHSNLQDKILHDLQHKYDAKGTKNKERPLRPDEQ